MATKKKAKKSDFYRLRMRVRLTQAGAAEMCGVTIRTIRNWDHRGAPLTAMRLLYAYDKKYVTHPGWDGWVFSRGAMVRGKIRLQPESLRHFAEWVEERSRAALQVAERVEPREQEPERPVPLPEADTVRFWHPLPV